MSEVIEKVPYKLPDDFECPSELLRDDWKLGIDRLTRAVFKMALFDPRLYPCGKLARDWMLGRGELLRSGQTASGAKEIINNFFVCIRTKEDVIRLIELGRNAAGLPAGTVDGAIAMVEGANPGPGQERRALVAAELHPDV